MSIKPIKAVAGFIDRDGNYHSDLNAIPEDLKEDFKEFFDEIPEDFKSRCRQVHIATYGFNDFRHLKTFLDTWDASEDGILYLYSIAQSSVAPFWYIRGLLEANDAEAIPRNIQLNTPIMNTP